MGRANPIPVVYMLINRVNKKIYIGETFNFAGRMSSYKSVMKKHSKYINRPIDKAIVEYGFDAFDIKILASKETHPDIEDEIYRCQLESEFIRAYDSMNPDIGYNSLLDDIHVRHYHRKSIKHKPFTKLIKSTPILVYDFDDNSVMMYLGKRSFGSIIGKDKAIIARCAKNGKSTSHYQIYDVDPKLRFKNAKNIIDKKRKYLANGLVAKTLARYVDGLIAVNKFCEKWELPTINIKELR